MDEKDRALCTKYRLDGERGEPHLDAAATVFFARQLEEIDRELYDVKYAKLEALELVATKPLHPGAEQYTYRQFDGVAVAEICSNYSTSSPRADVQGQEFTSRVRGVRNSYAYNVQEIRAAAHANLPLEPMRAAVARRGINECINRTALLGSAAHGIIGLFNQPNAQSFTVPAVGSGGLKTWASKSAAQILDDLFGIVDQVPTATNEVEHVKRLLLPYPRLRYISRLKIDAVSPITVLQFFRENRPEVEVRGALFLTTAGALGAARMVGYNPARENVELLLPIPFESFPPQLNGLEYKVENHARMGGVVCRYPLTMIYGDGI